MRKFRYLGTVVRESANLGRLTPGEVYECDTLSDTPDGGIPSEFWEEVDG